MKKRTILVIVFFIIAVLVLENVSNALENLSNVTDLPPILSIDPTTPKSFETPDSTGQTPINLTGSQTQSGTGGTSSSTTTGTTSSSSSSATPAAGASATEIYAFCRDNIYREKNGEIDFVQEILLSQTEATLTQWKSTLQQEKRKIQRMIDDEVDAMGNHASETQLEGFRMHIASIGEIINFLTEAINIKRDGTSSVEGSVADFVDANNRMQQHAYTNFGNYESREYGDFDDVLDNIGNYIPTEQDVPSEIGDMASVVLTVITNIGMILSILILAILGVKYMLGSLEERADYKKDLVPYLIGVGLLFGITTIVKILQQWGQNINNIEQKAEYKKDMVPYLTGAVLLFGISVILKILIGMGQSINNI